MYVQNEIENQFQSLTILMLRKAASKSPKLRGKAGEIRYVVPYLVDIISRMFSGHEPFSEEGTCAIAAQQLQFCYSH